MTSAAKGIFFARGMAKKPGTHVAVAKAPVERSIERTILFGQIQVPVTLHVATEDRQASLVLLDRRDMSPVGMRPFNKTTSKDLPKEDLVKGVQIGKEKFVIVTREDLQLAMPRTTQLMEIECTVNPRDVPPAYFLKTYHLRPTEGAKKPYALLRSALSTTRMAGLVHAVVATRQYIALILPDEHGLSLHLLHWQSEVKPQKDAASEVPVAPSDLAVAKRLVKVMAKPWTPGGFFDTFQDKIVKMVEKRNAAPTGLMVPLPGEQAPVRLTKANEHLELGGLLKADLKAVRSAIKEEQPDAVSRTKADEKIRNKLKPAVKKRVSTTS